MSNDKNEPRGRLIAIDGSRGKDTDRAAAALVDALKAKRVDCAVSRFDASGLFGELASAARKHGPSGAPSLRARVTDRQISARTLTLVYAADLAFRLRWEIRPVLDAGGVVIASPYVETAVAFGTACGLRENWIRELLRFAPKPSLRARAEERKINKGWKARLDRGYAEYSAAMLEASSPKLASKSTRREAVALLNQPRGRKVYRLSEKGVDALVRAVTGSLRAAQRRSASKPRSARK
ncbi:MAG TPA: hypothetical protein VJ691_05720 [Vicinamibacterales bacterium]|nr:hypothetical protein [Vicinamibacterales bacterium]